MTKVQNPDNQNKLEEKWSEQVQYMQVPDGKEPGDLSIF